MPVEELQPQASRCLARHDTKNRVMDPSVTENWAWHFAGPIGQLGKADDEQPRCQALQPVLRLGAGFYP